MKNQKALDQRGLKTLVFWVIWASVCTTVFVQLYHQADIWEYILHDGSHFTWVLVAVFVLGVVISFLHVILLTREWFCAYRLVYQIENNGLHGVRRVENRVVSRMFEAIKHMDQAGGQVDLTGLCTVEFASYMRVSRTITLLGSLLITLGLIGTVLGLTITLTGLNGALENVTSDGMSVLIGLRDAMSGMGLAFYTTLLGSIMGGVLLRVFGYISDNSIEALQDLMVRSCMVYASAQLTPSMQRDFQALGYVLEGMEARVSALTQSLYNSKHAMAEFAEEMRNLKTSTRLSEADDEVFKAIAAHRHYAKVLRYELNLQKQLANFKQRLLAALGFASAKQAKSSSHTGQD